MAELQHTRLHAGLYALAALLLIGQAAWFYLVGDYDRILLPALLAPLLITAALMRLGQPETARLSAYLVLVCGYLLVAMELPTHSSLAPFWLGLPPVLTLLLLPLGPAMLLNLTLTPLWLLLGENLLDLDLALGYLSLVMVAGLAPWEILHQRSLLQATDPLDEECDAIRRSALHERLHSECERAELLHQRLAVLVIHLPQLEMAGEQFGPGRDAPCSAPSATPWPAAAGTTTCWAARAMPTSGWCSPTPARAAPCWCASAWRRRWRVESCWIPASWRRA